MPRKITAVALSTILLVLYAYSEPYAHPLFLPDDSEILDVEQPAFPAGEKVEPAPQPAATKTSSKAEKKKTPPRPRFDPGRETAGKRGQKVKGKSPSAIANRRWKTLQRIYINRAKRPLIATSRTRTPYTQARVTRENIHRYGVRYVLRLYRNGPAIREIVRAWRTNRNDPRKAQAAMTEVIQSQVAHGVFISDHLRGLAVDVRTRGRNGARMGILRDVAQEVGATVTKEVDHAHIKLV
jgi:hypothetical protein